jgi:hypothetical protein
VAPTRRRTIMENSIGKVLIVLVGVFSCVISTNRCISEDEIPIYLHKPDSATVQLGNQFANKAVTLFQQGDAQGLVSLLSPKRRTPQALEYFKNSLREFDSTYGKAVTHEFKRAAISGGATFIEGKSISYDVYWYLYKTIIEKKSQSGVIYTIIRVILEDNQPASLGFYVETFDGVQEIPHWLSVFAQDAIREANLQLQDKNEETPHLAKERQRVLERFDGYDWSWPCWQDEYKLTLWKENITKLEKRGDYWLVIGYSSDRGKKEASTDEAGRILIIYDIENDKVTDWTHGGDLHDVEIDNDGKIIKGWGPEYC